MKKLGPALGLPVPRRLSLYNLGGLLGCAALVMVFGGVLGAAYGGALTLTRWQRAPVPDALFLLLEVMLLALGVSGFANSVASGRAYHFLQMLPVRGAQVSGLLRPAYRLTGVSLTLLMFGVGAGLFLEARLPKFPGVSDHSALLVDFPVLAVSTALFWWMLEACCLLGLFGIGPRIETAMDRVLIGAILLSVLEAASWLLTSGPGSSLVGPVSWLERSGIAGWALGAVPIHWLFMALLHARVGSFAGAFTCWIFAVAFIVLARRIVVTLAPRRLSEPMPGPRRHSAGGNRSREPFPDHGPLPLRLWVSLRLAGLDSPGRGLPLLLPALLSLVVVILILTGAWSYLRTACLQDRIVTGGITLSVVAAGYALLLQCRSLSLSAFHQLRVHRRWARRYPVWALYPVPARQHLVACLLVLVALLVWMLASLVPAAWLWGWATGVSPGAVIVVPGVLGTGVILLVLVAGAGVSLWSGKSAWIRARSDWLSSALQKYGVVVVAPVVFGLCQGASRSALPGPGLLAVGVVSGWALVRLLKLGRSRGLDLDDKAMSEINRYFLQR